MKRDNLDNIDVKILKTLQENGRVTNVELAEKLKMNGFKNIKEAIGAAL